MRGSALYFWKAVQLIFNGSAGDTAEMTLRKVVNIWISFSTRSLGEQNVTWHKICSQLFLWAGAAFPSGLWVGNRPNDWSHFCKSLILLPFTSDFPCQDRRVRDANLVLLLFSVSEQCMNHELLPARLLIHSLCKWNILQSRYVRCHRVHMVLKVVLSVENYRTFQSLFFFFRSLKIL